MKKWTIICVVVSFSVAALFYSPNIGGSFQMQIECPLCPYVDGLNLHPIENFLRLTFFCGILNTASLLVFALIVFLLFKGGQRIWRLASK